MITQILLAEIIYFVDNFGSLREWMGIKAFLFLQKEKP